MVLQELNVKIGLLLDEFQKNAAKAKEEAGSLKSAFNEMKGALVSYGVGSFLKDAIAEFADAERNSVRLESRIKSLGGNWEAMTDKVNDYIDSASQAAAIDDDELKKGMIALLDVTKNAEVSMSLLGDAMDLHKEKGMDVAAASDLMARAYQGDQRALTELGRMFGVARDKASDFTTVVHAMRAQIEGSATGTKDLEHGIDRISTAFGNTKEEVGKLFSAGGVWTGFTAGILDVTTKGLKIINAFQDALRASWANIGSIFKKGFKATHDDAKKIFDDFINDTVDILKKGEEKKTKTTKVESGKRQKWMDDQDKADRKQEQKELQQKIRAEDQYLKNRIAMGQATNAELLDQMKTHAKQIEAAFGQNSVEYQEYIQTLQEFTLESNEQTAKMVSGLLDGISSGFEEAFVAIAKDGADASKAVEVFARAMGRSMLNSIASAIDGEIIKGTAGYLTNMLMAGPVGAVGVSAYSIPLLAGLAATSGMIHGLAAMMADGGTLTRPGLVMMAEKATGEPETAIPLSRMDEVFTKYSQYLGKKNRGTGGNTIIIQRVNDNRGAGVVAASNYEQAKAAKTVGDILVRRGVIKR